MHSRRLLLLFVVALVAVGAYLLVELPGQRAADRSREEAAQLFTFDPSTVDRIELDRDDGTLVFVLTGTHWTMQSPLHDDAEPGAVMPIAANLARAEIERDLGEVAGLARFGLAHPPVTVRLFAGADTIATLALGDATVDRAAVYARRPDGHVLLVPTSVREAVTLGVNDYRNRRVVVFDLDAVRAYELHTRLRDGSAWRRGRGETWYTVVAGDTIAGDSIAVPAVLRRLRGMRVGAFPTDPDTSAGAVVGVTIHKDDGSAQSVRFFHAGDAWLAQVSSNPRIVQVDDDPTDIAQESVATLRDRRVLQFDPVAAQRMTITTPDTSAVLVRAGDHWALPNPALGDVDPRRAADLVRALRALRFERLIPHTPIDPASHASFSLVIAGAGDRIIDELQCTPAPGDTIWVARSRSLGATCEIRADALHDITGIIARLRR